MSAWRVDRHYGYGAARIRVQGGSHAGTENEIADGLRTVLYEWTHNGFVGVVKRVAEGTPAILLGVLILACFFYTLNQDHSDNSAIEVVMFDSTPVLPEVLPEPVVPEVPPVEEIIEIAEAPKPKPEPVKPKPEPPPVLPKPEPPPPPPTLAERPKPPPPPKAKPRPRPKPVIPQIARVEPPKPKPVVRPDRAKPTRPQPIERPRVAIDRVAPKPTAPKPAVQRMARANTPRPSAPRTTPRLAAPAAPAMDAPPPPPERAFRVAKAKPTAGARPRALPGIAPAPKSPKLAPQSTGARPQRTSGPRAKAPRMPRAVAPAMAAAAIPNKPAPALPRSNREARDNPRASSRKIPLPVAIGTQAVPKPSAPAPKLASRAGRTKPGTQYASADERPGVAGVPLGDLAACVSDREEDRLKQAIVAAVKTQEECVSRKGTYRFIETKNLNAFLMWIDRAPSRGVEDRCAELRYALECIQSASRRAAR